MLPSCLTPCKYKYRERRSHFLALSKDNHAQSGVPSQIRGQLGRQAASLSYAGSWPWGGDAPLAVLVWIARPPVGEVTAYPPLGSPAKPGAAAIQLSRGSILSIYQGQQTHQFGLAYRVSLRCFFICFKPRSTERRTALSFTPSALATSQ